MLNQMRYENHGTDYFNGDTRTVTCTKDHAPIDPEIPMTLWGEDWYPGKRSAKLQCIDGSWTNLMYLEWGATKPKDLLCVPKSTIKLLREADHLVKWSQLKLDETKEGGYPWLDGGAGLRMGGLVNGMDNARNFIASTLKAKIAPDFAIQAAIDAMNAFRMVPHGIPHSEETCKDFESHFLWQLKKTNGGGLGYDNHIPEGSQVLGYPTSKDLSIEQAIGISCRFAIDKRAMGFDPVARKALFFYRDGCFCESKWVNGCPMQLHMTPNFKLFGFDALEEKVVSSSPGSSTNSLCWYWSKNDHPEWGYLPHPDGMAFQNAPKNFTDLKVATNAKAKALLL